MGTSKRRTNEKIKKLLKEKSETIGYEQAVAEVAIQVLSNHPFDKHFSKQDFEIILTKGIQGVGSISSRTLRDDFGYEGPIDSNPVNIEAIIEKILDDLGDNEISDMLKTALKVALAAVLRIDPADKLGTFLMEFCYYLLYLLIQRDIIEALGDAYVEDSTSTMDDQIKTTAKKIVQASLIDPIKEYEKGGLEISALIEEIIQKAATVRLEF